MKISIIADLGRWADLETPGAECRGATLSLSLRDLILIKWVINLQCCSLVHLLTVHQRWNLRNSFNWHKPTFEVDQLFSFKSRGPVIKLSFRDLILMEWDENWQCCKSTCTLTLHQRWNLRNNFNLHNRIFEVDTLFKFSCFWSRNFKLIFEGLNISQI